MRVSRVVVAALFALGGIVVGALLWPRDKAPPAQAPPAAPEPPAAASTPARLPEPPPPPAAAAPTPPAKAAAPGEEEAMARIRDSVKSAPLQALDLIATADRAHPDSAFTEERASLRIDALVYAGDVGRARDHAEEYLQRYPDGAFAEHVERLTGVHPRPPAPGAP